MPGCPSDEKSWCLSRQLYSERNWNYFFLAMAGNLYILARISVICFGSKRLIRLVCCRPFFIRPSFGPFCWYDNIFFIQNVFFPFNSQLMRRKLFVLNEIIVLYLFEKNVGNGNQTKTISLFLFFYIFSLRLSFPVIFDFDTKATFSMFLQCCCSGSYLNRTPVSDFISLKSWKSLPIILYLSANMPMSTPANRFTRTFNQLALSSESYFLLCQSLLN